MIVGSDSSHLIILEYDPQTNSFVQLHQENYGTQYLVGTNVVLFITFYWDDDHRPWDVEIRPSESSH